MEYVNFYLKLRLELFIDTEDDSFGIDISGRENERGCCFFSCCHLMKRLL